MRYLLVFALLIILAGTTVAADLGSSQQTVKSNDHVLHNMSFDREGGNTIAEAVVIDDLPFFDTGATCDNTNDYDEVCPYSESLSPDVVYAYTATIDFYIAVNLCESLYDTKTYIYDDSMNLIACNDDADCGFSGYQSELEAVWLESGVTYYLVVDGYGSDCGEYELYVDFWNGGHYCEVECDGMVEGEPPLVSDYVDDYNGGCNSPLEDAWQIVAADENGEVDFCGVSGWYQFNTTDYRDTDWLIGTVGPSGVVEIIVDPEKDFWFVILEDADCDDIQIAMDLEVDQCEPDAITYEGTPGDPIYMIALPPDWQNPEEWNYALRITGLEPGPVAAEDISFGAVKALYR